ncbi:TetR/AcrR family transcriptional regulator [Arthrobacter sp. JSM 101049]|uniref:TetR/AcrR family transcriptional regulator n=1 Tax=Arthrobacter sp. JSM 101049 TaxID=929097 RepID=UPI0035670C2B
MVGIKKPEGERRRDIIRASQSVALHGGIESVTVRTVAAEAGLSIGLVYFYYDSKEGLLHALLDRLLEITLDGPPPGFGESLSPADALNTMMAEELEGLQSQRGELDLIFQFYFARRNDEFRGPINQALDEYAARMEPVAARISQAAGVEPEALRSALAALIYGATMDVVRRPGDFSAPRLLGVVSGLAEAIPGH